jgi:UDP-2-acetamido-2,6-beta-L-arabino-hexul-4-ose reductase
LVADRDAFADTAKLDAFVANSDIIVHLAGVNRGTDDEVADGNRALAAALAGAIDRSDKPRRIIYSSSTQRDQANVYGTAKAAVADILKAAGARCGGSFVELVLPNLFGEFTRPRYNSFVGTFCALLANGEEPTVNADAEVSLLHYQDAADAIAEAISATGNAQLRPAGRSTSVGAVDSRLRRMLADYRLGIVPDLRDRFDLQLFNTLRSYLYPNMYPFALERKQDNRGALFEVVKERNGGQVFYSSTLPGITRGNHFHFDKVERFLVLSGQARISIRKVLSNETHYFDVSGDIPCFVDMPTLHTHNITNTGPGELLTLFWSHDIFDPARPDTYMELV